MMLAATIVLIGASAVVLIGSVVELIETLRQRREHLTSEEALARLLDARPAAILAWIGLASCSLLMPALWRDSGLALADAALVIAILGFAAERASYLVTVWASPSSQVRPFWLASVSVAVVTGGLTVGLTT